MGILTRYLIRAHAGPFLFALTALTGLLFLNAVAQRLQDLAGKGLTWEVIFDFLVLSLPHTVALTLPMAVLVSVLYAFSDLTANNELTAMKAGGIRPQRLLAPMLGVGTIVALLMLVFNDRVLPEANHSLKNLLVDINRKTPTLTLREQVFNRIDSQSGSGRVFLQAALIDNTTNALYDVTIVDNNDPLRYRTTFADSGSMAFNASRTDLYLVLHDGVSYETNADPPGTFQQVHFEKQVVPLRGIGNEMQRTIVGLDRSDREMTLDMLALRARLRSEQVDSIQRENLVRSRNAVRFALGEPVANDPEVFGSAPFASPLTPQNTDPAGFPIVQSPDLQQASAPVDHTVRRLAMATRTRQNTAASFRRTADQARVEIHKKYSLAVACVIFVLLGAPLAVRFPRGGLGMVIAVSSAIFAVYWVGLIGGEQLADRGLASPVLAMWVPNVVFGLLGLVLARRMGREAATMRGGGWDDLLFTLREGLLAPFRRNPRRRA